MIARLTTTKTLKANLQNIQTLAFSLEAMSGPAHTLCFQSQDLLLPQLYELRVYHCILTIHLTYSGARQRATTHNTGLRK